MLPIKEIEKFVKKETKNVSSVVHDFGHAKRTAIWTKWFVKILGGTKEDEKLAYIAGLLHDIVRPPSNICHAAASAEKSRKILKKFKLSDIGIEKIVSAIATHRDMSRCETILQKALIYADKIPEQMGAFIVFRRCMFIGECIEYENREFHDVIISHFEEKLTKYSPKDFPKRFSKFLKYQYELPKKFWLAFQNNEDWSVEIARYFYDCGKSGVKFEKAIKRFKPKYKQSKLYKKEALNYINGKLTKKFQEMIAW